MQCRPYTLIYHCTFVVRQSYIFMRMKEHEIKENIYVKICIKNIILLKNNILEHSLLLINMRKSFSIFISYNLYLGRICCSYNLNYLIILFSHSLTYVSLNVTREYTPNWGHATFYKGFTPSRGCAIMIVKGYFKLMINQSLYLYTAAEI